MNAVPESEAYDPTSDPDCQLAPEEILGLGSNAGKGPNTVPASSLGQLEQQEGVFSYVTRALVSPGTVVALFGDLHGSIHSFLRQLLDL